MAIKTLMKNFRVAVISLLGCLWASSLMGQPPKKELIYQREIVGNYIFEGAVISKDGREPEVEDPYWLAYIPSDRIGQVSARNRNKWKKNWEDKSPFDYIFRIKVGNEPVNSHIICEIHLDQIPDKELNTRNLLGQRGPLWFAGMDNERNILALWRYQDEGNKTPDRTFLLYYWDFKTKKFLDQPPLWVEVGKNYPEKPLRFHPPKSLISPSGKYLAIISSYSDEPNSLLQNHIKIIKFLHAGDVSLAEQQSRAIAPYLNGKKVKISEVIWHPGDLLECTFTEVESSNALQVKSDKVDALPVNGKSQAARPELRTSTLVENLFK